MKWRNKEREGGRRISREVPCAQQTPQQSVQWSRRCQIPAAACTVLKATKMKPLRYTQTFTWCTKRRASVRGAIHSGKGIYLTPLISTVTVHTKKRRVLRRLDQISRAVLPGRWHLAATSWIPAFTLTIFRPELERNYSSTRIFHLMWSNVTASVIENSDIFPLSQFCYYMWEMF
jgi:hypothetical protein